jgi:hypothetical protein
MKKFKEYLLEDLSGSLVEPQSNAAVQAKQLGLVYVGFGRYEDPNTRQITHIVQNDRLVPFAKAVKTNTYQQQSSDDYGSYAKAMRPEIDQVSVALTNHYKPEKYKVEELDAIQMYTNTAYSDVNQRLISLPMGINARDIQPTSPDDYVPGIINNMDSDLAKSKAPLVFTVYTGLGGNYDPTQFAPGQEMSFKSFRSSSLNPNVVLNNIGRDGEQSVALLQIQVQKDSNGIYVNDFSSNPDESEYILPRGAKIQIIDGPLRSVGSNQFTQESNLQVKYFKCILAK